VRWVPENRQMCSLSWGGSSSPLCCSASAAREPSTLIFSWILAGIGQLRCSAGELVMVRAQEVRVAMGEAATVEGDDVFIVNIPL
jgi:hypothetical protein